MSKLGFISMVCLCVEQKQLISTARTRNLQNNHGRLNIGYKVDPLQSKSRRIQKGFGSYQSGQIVPFGGLVEEHEWTESR